MSVVTAESNQAVSASDRAFPSPNVKPFKDIPGPKGLPYLGTILHYRKGIYNCAKIILNKNLIGIMPHMETVVTNRCKGA
jgi:hypothetical protein